VRGAPSARAKRAQGGEQIKVSGRLITAILFGSAARRCSWENRIFCYQMTVRFEVVFAENAFVSRTVADASSATSEKLNDVRRIRWQYKPKGQVLTWRTWPFGWARHSAFDLDRLPYSGIPLLWVDFEWLEGRSRRDERSVAVNRVRTLAGETVSLAARLSSTFNNVLVTFYILWFIELFTPTFIAPMLICLANSRLAVRRIVEEGLPRFAFGTRYDQVPLERLTSR
jgi:hypothetical protein